MKQFYCSIKKCFILFESSNCYLILDIYLHLKKRIFLNVFS
nr:hypothetical protein CoNPh37_CDS0097 [Staphylococcus phage S-CoN_Ph37]